jgi:hypothetical protein
MVREASEVSGLRHLLYSPIIFTCAMLLWSIGVLGSPAEPPQCDACGQRAPWDEWGPETRGLVYVWRCPHCEDIEASETIVEAERRRAPGLWEEFGDDLT